MADTNIKIANVEYTQAIQYFNFPKGQGSGFAADNSIPLVNRKPTILRLYVDTQRNDPNVAVPTRVDGIVWAFNPETGTGGVYRSLNGPIAARQVGTITRTNFNHTLNFMIPWSVCETNVLCQLVIFDADNRGSPNRNDKFLNLDFINLPALDLHCVLIHYTGVDFFDRPVDQQTTALDVLATLDYVLRTFPISDFNFDGCEVINWNAKLAVGANFYALSDKLGAMRAMSGTDDVYIGLIPGAAGCGGTCGLGGGGTALFFASGTIDNPGASHEIGHALGRSHTPQCTAGDPNYPQYNGFPRDSIGECGVDTRKLVTFDPATAVDYMSYCNAPNWTSPYGYLAMMGALRSGNFSSGDTGALGPWSVWSAEKVDCYYMAFRVHRGSPDPQVTINSAFHLARIPPRPPLSRATDTWVELLGADDEPLFTAPCFSGAHAEEPMPFEELRAYFPNYRELRALQIVQGGKPIAKFKVAAEAPRLGGIKLEMTKSARAPLGRLSWKGSAGTDAVPSLQYGVRYSNDGVRWRPVEASITENTIVVNMDLLPGGRNCRFQVVASAGFRTTTLETDEFQREIKPRSAYLLAPAADSEFELGTPITFVGTGFSPDFGNAKSGEIAWKSLAEPSIGIGQQVTRTDLPVGTHHITMQVPDGMGGIATASTSIKIVPKRAPCESDEVSARERFESWKAQCGCK